IAHYAQRVNTHARSSRRDSIRVLHELNRSRARHEEEPPISYAAFCLEKITWKHWPGTRHVHSSSTPVACFGKQPCPSKLNLGPFSSEPGPVRSLEHRSRELGANSARTQPRELNLGPSSLVPRTQPGSVRRLGVPSART